jgi:hypothetical protein
MLATAYLLFIVTKGELPGLTAIGTYPDSASCREAATQITEILKSGGFDQAIVCITQQSLEDLAKSNDLGSRIPPPQPDE